MVLLVQIGFFLSYFFSVTLNQVFIHWSLSKGKDLFLVSDRKADEISPTQAKKECNGNVVKAIYGSSL